MKLMQEFTASRRVADEVLNERLRQKFHLNYNAAHDDAYTEDELSRAAAVYATYGVTGTLTDGAGRFVWPDGWDVKHHPARKGKSRRECLIAAAALVLAEIERMDRAAIRLTDKKQEPDDSVGAFAEDVLGGRDEAADREAAKIAAAEAGPPMESTDGESLLKASARVRDRLGPTAEFVIPDSLLVIELDRAFDAVDYAATVDAEENGCAVAASLIKMGVPETAVAHLMLVYWNPRRKSPWSPGSISMFVNMASLTCSVLASEERDG